MFLVVVIAVVVILVAIAAYQWVRPTRGKGTNGKHELTQGEMRAGIERTGNATQYSPPT
jgi:type II secretory pathway pseudopilin PulG